VAAENRIYLPDVIGGGYADFWHFKGRYRVCKGSRASKKSKTTALWFITNMMKYPQANTLVIRKTGNTLKGSCFTELKWAIHRLGVDAWWKVTESPMEMTYKPTGQKIFFRGLDDPLKVTSIAAGVGSLCWMWIEEAYEVMNEADFDILDESIRGRTTEGLFKQITLTFNPWNELHWLKARFFDVKSPDILAKTTNYMCNEFLDARDLQLFEDMKQNRPKRYRVAGLGDWGIVEGIVFDNWTVEDLADKIPHFANRYHGLDFGFSDDPNAFISFDVEQAQKKIYIFDELYQTHMLNDDLAKKLRPRMLPGEWVTCDSASPLNIEDLCRYDIDAVPAIKGPNSVNYGIQFLQGYDIIIDKRCVNTIKEISNYQYQKDKFGRSLQKPVDADNHLMDALRYGTEPLQYGSSAATSAHRI
jgi:phage terminase large subunit